MSEARGRKSVKLSADDLLIRIQTWEFQPTKTHQGKLIKVFTLWTNWLEQQNVQSVLLYRLETMFQGCSPSNINAVNVNNTDFMMRPSFQSVHQRSRMACVHHSPRHCHLQNQVIHSTPTKNSTHWCNSFNYFHIRLWNLGALMSRQSLKHNPPMFPCHEKLGSWKTMGGLIFHQTNGKVVPMVTYSEVSMGEMGGCWVKVFLRRCWVNVAPTIPFVNRL